MPSLWLQHSPPFGAGAPPPARTDVAVVGGGIAGICTALSLAQSGVRVTVLEAGVVAGRASGRNDGQLLQSLGEHYHRLVAQFGADRARSLCAFLRDNSRMLKAAIAAHGIACDLVERGGMRLAETPHEAEELATAAALLHEEAIGHELLSAAAVVERIPAAKGFHGALHLHGESVVQPVAMVRGLAQAAVAHGAVICEGREVVAVDGAAGSFRLALRHGGRLEADLVVHATSTLARHLDRSGFLQAKVFPFRGQVLASAPLPASHLAGLPPYAMSSNFCYEYFRVHRDRFVVGGMRWSVPGEEVGIVDDSTGNPAVTRNLLAFVQRHFPALATTPFPIEWTGIMAGTPDALPLCGELPGQPGLYAHLAFNGYGLGFACLGGQCLAEAIVHGSVRHPAAAMFAPRRFV